MSRVERCETCRFWDKFIDDRGECRRKSKPDPPAHSWPNTYDDDWCGEWRSKEPEKSE